MRRRDFIKTAAVGNAGLLAAPAILAGTARNGAGNTEKRIKVGQIGICHEHSSGFINTLKKMPEIFEIVGIVDDRSTKAAKFAGKDLKPYDGLTWMTEEELLNSSGLQAVLVETPNTDLVSTALRCVEHNLAIHMDKPAGEDLELFARLLKECKERNLPFQMGYMFRNNPAFQLCLKAVKENWLGDIFEIHAGMSHNYGGPEYQKYISNFKGGIMFNLGCHHIDIVVSMLGRPEKITPFLKSTPGAANDAKNNCMTIIEYPHTNVSIYACDLEVDGNKHRRFKISGSKGTIEFSPLERFDGQPLQIRLTLLEGNEEYAKGTHTVDFGIILDRYEDQLHELAKMIRGQLNNPRTFEHDYLAHEVLMAASGYTEWK